jgi:hypothetical protein
MKLSGLQCNTTLQRKTYSYVYTERLIIGIDFDGPISNIENQFALAPAEPTSIIALQSQ